MAFMWPYVIYLPRHHIWSLLYGSPLYTSIQMVINRKFPIILKSWQNIWPTFAYTLGPLCQPSSTFGPKGLALWAIYSFIRFFFSLSLSFSPMAQTCWGWYLPIKNTFDVVKVILWLVYKGHMIQVDHWPGIVNPKIKINLLILCVCSKLVWVSFFSWR